MGPEEKLNKCGFLQIREKKVVPYKSTEDSMYKMENSCSTVELKHKEKESDGSDGYLALL